MHDSVISGKKRDTINLLNAIVIPFFHDCVMPSLPTQDEGESCD